MVQLGFKERPGLQERLVVALLVHEDQREYKAGQGYKDNKVLLA
jgi:hypothetical protein